MLFSIPVTKHINGQFSFPVPGAINDIYLDSLEQCAPVLEEIIETYANQKGVSVHFEVTLDHQSRLIVQISDAAFFLALNLKRVVDQSHLNESQILEKMKWTSRSQISTLTSGRHLPSISKMSSFLEVFGLDIEVRFVPRKQEADSRPRISAKAG